MRSLTLGSGPVIMQCDTTYRQRGFLRHSEELASPAGCLAHCLGVGNFVSVL